MQGLDLLSLANQLPRPVVVHQHLQLRLRLPHGRCHGTLPGATGADLVLQRRDEPHAPRPLQPAPLYTHAPALHGQHRGVACGGLVEGPHVGHLLLLELDALPQLPVLDVHTSLGLLQLHELWDGRVKWCVTYEPFTMTTPPTHLPRGLCSHAFNGSLVHAAQLLELVVLARELRVQLPLHVVQVFLQRLQLRLLVRHRCGEHVHVVLEVLHHVALLRDGEVLLGGEAGLRLDRPRVHRRRRGLGGVATQALLGCEAPLLLLAAGA